MPPICIQNPLAVIHGESIHVSDSTLLGKSVFVREKRDIFKQTIPNATYLCENTSNPSSTSQPENR